MKTADQATLISRLNDPACYPHPVDRLQMIETHISYVWLTGPLAYKIKKAVCFEFLDFSTLALRRFYCEEELRLNRRFAPQLYVQVLPIVTRGGRVHVGGEGTVLDYAVQMREFDQSLLFSSLLLRRQLDASQIEQLAQRVAAFHRVAAIASAGQDFGRPAQIAQQMADNFAPIQLLLGDPAQRRSIDFVRDWAEQQSRVLDRAFEERRNHGFIRECHGDLHLRNVALLDGQPTLFDCIEFSASLRWIDIASEVAFIVMDLHAAGRGDLATSYLNAYLAESGDYAGLAILRYYLVYRALVRAKVNALQTLQQRGADTRAVQRNDQVIDYLRLAQSFCTEARPALLITHGFSGSGKTAISKHLAERIGAIRLRSDVERKRLHGLPAMAGSGSGLTSGLYRTQVTEQTYEHLLCTAATILSAGFSVIVDATFLAYEQRLLFAQWAREANRPYAIIDFQAPLATLRSRLRQRRGDASEADAAVLEQQLNMAEPLQPSELPATFAYDSRRPLGDAALAPVWQPLIKRL